MNHGDDPVRLSEAGSGVPDELRSLLQESRAAVGSPDQVGQLAAGLAAKLGPAAGLGASAGTASFGGAKLAGVLALGVALTGGGLWLVESQNASTTPSVTEPAAESISVPQSLVQHAVVQHKDEPGPEAMEQLEPPAAKPAQPPEPTQPVVRHTSTPEKPSEAALLGQAQAALASNPKRALALTQQHAKLYPKGALTQEREVIAIAALKQIGAADQAQERAADFEKRFKGSVHERKVKSSTGSPDKP